MEPEQAIPYVCRTVLLEIMSKAGLLMDFLVFAGHDPSTCSVKVSSIERYRLTELQAFIEEQWIAPSQSLIDAWIDRCEEYSRKVGDRPTARLYERAVQWAQQRHPTQSLSLQPAVFESSRIQASKSNEIKGSINSMDPLLTAPDPVLAAPPTLDELIEKFGTQSNWIRVEPWELIPIAEQLRISLAKVSHAYFLRSHRNLL